VISLLICYHYFLLWSAFWLSFTTDKNGVRVMVFNATFNNISVISCRSVFLVEKTISLNDIILLVSTKTDSDTENYQSVRRQTHCDVIDKNLTTALNFSNTLSLVWYHCSSYQTRFDILSIISANVESSKIIQVRCTLYNIMW
jgi:hypothetical protein